MSITSKDAKLLWGRAAGRCSICGKELTEGKIGEQAHIVAEDPNGPRGNSSLNTDQRNSYSNLILLCPNHHTEIDKNPQNYSVEYLHWIKDNHEMRMLERTSPRPRQTDLLLIYDLLVLTCKLQKLLKYLYCSVPSQNAEDFFYNLHAFWGDYNISTRKIDNTLVSGIEVLLRPLENGGIKDDYMYVHEKLCASNAIFSEYAKEKKIAWMDNPRDGVCPENILDIFGINLDKLLSSQNAINDLDYRAIQHAVFIAQYLKKCLKDREYSEISEVFINQFFECITPYFEQIGFRLPILPDEDEYITMFRLDAY